MFTDANLAQFTMSIQSVRHDFKVLSFVGTEAISALYSIAVELVSEHSDFDIENLLSQPAFLQFGLNGEGIHGRIEDITIGEVGRRLTHYQLTLVPSLHYLQFSHNHRIFQHLTVPQIVSNVLQQHGMTADTFAFNANNSKEREYCTQYAESDYAFIQRLCSEDGISFHHEHSPDGHFLVFSDAQTYFPKLDETSFQNDTGLLPDHPVVSQFSMRFSTRTSKTTRRGYDFTRPSLLLESQYSAEFTPFLEDYQHPSQMESLDHGKLLSNQALERHRADYQLAKGISNQPALRSGYFLELKDHPKQQYNDLWLIHSVHHDGKQPQVLEEATPEDAPQGYRNTFAATPWDVVYRPALIKRPNVLVSQTARVTGPEGEEIFCDEYGRVKVEMNWDRAELNSDKSSCWLRVSSSWAGANFGAVVIPRIGMEVLVTFLEGNPDNPLITGCVPNKITPAPYELPTHKSKSVFRTHSTPHTGGYSELTFEDRAGSERVFLQAERDHEQLIKNDSTTKIGNDRHEQIAKNSNSLIGLNRSEQVDADSSSLIKGNETHTTQGMRNTSVGKNDLVTIAGDSSSSVAGTFVVQAGAHAHINATNVVINAGASLTLNAGGNHVVISGAGIFSSVPIVLGGAPLPGTPAIQAVQAIAAAQQPIITTPLSIMESVKQIAAEFCPLCQACAAGLCSIGSAA